MKPRKFAVIMTSRSYVLEGQVCPECGKKMDRAKGLDGGKPQTGDISLCYGCGAVSLFNHELQLVTPTKNQWKSIRDDVENWATIRAFQKAIREKRLLLGGL